MASTVCQPACFAATMQKGVYRCENVLARRVTLISLNELVL
jgi:hypothetical protein